MKVAMTYCDPTIDINTAGADIETIRDTVFENGGVPMETLRQFREHYASRFTLRFSPNRVGSGETMVKKPRMVFLQSNSVGVPLTNQVSAHDAV